MSRQDDDRPDDRPDDSVAEAISAWPAPEPPAGFAERVVAAHKAQPSAEVSKASSGRNRLLIPSLVVGAAAIAILVFGLVRNPSLPRASGNVTASSRTTVDLGTAGVAVAEAGASFDWSVSGRTATIEQAAGDVFYRVEHKGDFVVKTSLGRAEVTGTCFRVFLSDHDKPSDKRLTVTVLEGSVRVVDKAGHSSDAGAGQVVTLSPDGLVATPDQLVWVEQSMSHEQLLQRDRVQRAEIADLRRRLKELEQDKGGGKLVSAGREPGPDGRPWFDPGPELLKSWVDECRIRVDLPPVADPRGVDHGRHAVAMFKLEAHEAPAVQQVFDDVRAMYVGELRTLYIAVTGDRQGADNLSAGALASEIQGKSPVERGRVRRQIAKERAGLARPPTDLSSLEPAERYLRLITSLGDETERRLADKLGAARARELRAEHGGWPMAMEMVGCDHDEADENESR